MAKLEALLRPIEGVSMLDSSDADFTVRLEKIEGIDNFYSLGKVHFARYKPSNVEEIYHSEPAVAAVVVEADYIYGGFGTIVGYDDEGCEGSFDVDVYDIEKDERPA